MPTYAYRGSTCGHEFETVQKFADDPLTECIICGQPVRRVVQPVGVVFKGSGWYINDSRTSGKSANGSSEKGDAAAKPASDTATDSGASKKPEATTPAAKEPAKSTVKSAD
jgi:putative FmdB family regulatory protein